MTKTEAVMKEILQEFPKFRLVPKAESSFCVFLDYCIRFITLNQNKSFLSQYYTTIGYTVYVPEAWGKDTDRAKYVALRHERVHMRQYERLGGFLFALTYLLPYLPLGLAYGRARLEWEAYEETMRASVDVAGADILLSDGFRNYIVSQFTGPAYGWMWPFASTVNRWYDEAKQRLRP